MPKISYSTCYQEYGNLKTEYVMEAFYFKNKVKYLNGEAKDYCFYKLTKDGKITSISKNKRVFSAPKSITINEGFEAIDKEEFEKVKQELGF